MSEIFKEKPSKPQVDVALQILFPLASEMGVREINENMSTLKKLSFEVVKAFLTMDGNATSSGT